MDFWLTGCDVFIACTDNGGDPGYDPFDGHGWDRDDDGVYYIIDPDTGQPIRDPDDIVPTIIFKQVDP